MAVTVSIPFDSLLQTIHNLDLSEKQELWDFLEAELEAKDLDDQEEIEVTLAYQDYEAGNYVTLDHYHDDRLSQIKKSTL